jgi:ubiquinone/menaquinone biosynthesis C-methylase UbiE
MEMKVEILKIKEWWEKNVPMAFKDLKLSYEEKRKFRYSLQDYMLKTFQFWRYKGNRVLEIGSGSGIDSAEFAKYGAYVISMDLTKTATHETKMTLIESNFYYNSDVVQASAHYLPFRENCIDVVYSFGVLHHIPNVNDAMKEIKRVLKKNGKVMAMLYNKDSLLYAYSIIYLRGIKNGLLKKHTEDEILSMFSERIFGCPYTKAYTKEEAIKLFENYFKNVKASVHYNVIDTLEKRKVKIVVPKDLELGWHIVIKAKKI